MSSSHLKDSFALFKSLQCRFVRYEPSQLVIECTLRVIKGTRVTEGQAAAAPGIHPSAALGAAALPSWADEGRECGDEHQKEEG
jgi:hypothetical protein